MRQLLVCLAATLGLLPGTAFADFIGRVINVHDGDTLTVLVDHQQIRVRLDSIDAPELGQPFGRASKQSLSKLCMARQARVEERGKDRYGRTIGRVFCGTVDANTEQVRKGMAWVFVKYTRKGSPLYQLQTEARLQRIGLWADQQRPISPWEWRARTRRTAPAI
jgi:endonuclease YncB( thermonuclease family)